MAEGRQSREDRHITALRGYLRDGFLKEAQARSNVRTVEEERASRTLKPTVIVGIGGAGCGVGAQLKMRLQQYYRDMPEQLAMVRFVMFDTERLASHSNADVRSAFVEAGEYVFLGGFNPRNWLSDHLVHDPCLRRWWPKDAKTDGQTIETGCKRLRPLGRLCAYYHRITIQQALTNAVNRALELDRGAVNNGNLPPLGQGQLSVHVISGSCGGTGSGMFLDILTLVRRVLAEQGQAGVEWSAIVVMPTFYRMAGANVSVELRDGRSANGYAFLRELQHFYHRHDDWSDYVMDAEERSQAGADRLADGNVPAQSCYLMDNEVSGRVLTDVQDIFRITADALFQKLTRPVVGARLVDVAANLGDLVHDRVRAFSSMGVSYVIYPRNTIARCAGSTVLRDLIDNRLRRVITDAERSQADQEATALFGRHGTLLDVLEVQRELQETAKDLKPRLPTAAKIQESARTLSRPARKRAMEEALQKTEALIEQARRQVRQAKASKKHAAEELLTRFLIEEIQRLCGSDSLYYVKEVLERLKDKVVKQEPQLVGGTGQPDVAAALAIDSTTRLETDWWPDFLQKKHLDKQIDEFAGTLATWFGAEITSEAAALAKSYREEVVANAIKDAMERCDRALAALETLRNQLDTISKDTDPVPDEHNVAVTTRYVPDGGVDAEVRQTVQEVEADSELWNDFRARLKEGNHLWRLGDPGDDARFAELEKTSYALTSWICSRPQIDAVLTRSLADAVESSIGVDEFMRTMSEALNLADPTWRIDPDKVGGELQPAGFLIAGLPRGFPPEYLPPAVREAAPDAVELPSHCLMLLRIEHALPLHVLAGIRDLKDKYTTCKNRQEWRLKSPHIENEWVQTPDTLEDVYPRSQHVLAMSFALGLFTHWLVTQKQLSEAQQIIHSWQNGVVYERTPNQFHVVQLRKVRGRLQVQGERQLNHDGGRAAAMANFSEEDERNVSLFLEQLSNSIGADSVRRYVGEYCDAVLVPKTGPHAEVADQLKQQLQRELDALQSMLE